jgi:hypothetical protein
MVMENSSVACAEVIVVICIGLILLIYFKGRQRIDRASIMIVMGSGNNTIQYNIFIPIRVPQGAITNILS